MAAVIHKVSRHVFYNSYAKYRWLHHVYRREFCSSTASELVRISKEGHLYIIGINRPEKRNCVNSEVAVHLRAAFEMFDGDPNASIAVLHGIGGTFCAGYDLKEIASRNDVHLCHENGPMGPTRMCVKKPVIAAIDGYAVAGGFELALWCDLRVVEESAIMGVFCRRFGVPLLDGGTVRLPHLIGLARALDLILTGRGISGREASNMGLVTKLCGEGKALETAISLANDLAKLPQQGLNVDKNSAKRVTYDAKSLEAAFKFEMEAAIPVLKEASLGAAKFFQQSGVNKDCTEDKKQPT